MYFQLSSWVRLSPPNGWAQISQLGTVRALTLELPREGIHLERGRACLVQDPPPEHCSLHQSLMNQELPVQFSPAGTEWNGGLLPHPLLWEHQHSQALRADNPVCFNLAGSTLKLPCFCSTLTAPGLLFQPCYYSPELSVQGQTPVETGGELGVPFWQVGGWLPALPRQGAPVLKWLIPLLHYFKLAKQIPGCSCHTDVQHANCS